MLQVAGNAWSTYEYQMGRQTNEVLQQGEEILNEGGRPASSFGKKINMKQKKDFGLLF